MILHTLVTPNPNCHIMDCNFGYQMLITCASLFIVYCPYIQIKPSFMSNQDYFHHKLIEDTNYRQYWVIWLQRVNCGFLRQYFQWFSCGFLDHCWYPHFLCKALCEHLTQASISNFSLLNSQCYDFMSVNMSVILALLTRFWIL
jgi:hypothetical protein